MTGAWSQDIRAVQRLPRTLNFCPNRILSGIYSEGIITTRHPVWNSGLLATAESILRQKPEENPQASTKFTLVFEARRNGIFGHHLAVVGILQRFLQRQQENFHS